MKKKNFKSRRSSGSKNATVTSMTSAAGYAAVAGRDIPDHELTTFSPANMVRRFDLDEPSNGPSIVYRLVGPYAAFHNGYSDSDISAQDCGAAIATTTADPTQALYPITDFAAYFEQDVFPILLNLFASGTGKRYEVTINEIIRLQAMGVACYEYLLTPVIINKLTFHTDWTKIAPFTGTVPSHLYKIAENIDATDIGIAETWYPRMRRMDNLILFPRMLSEAKRMLTPMMSVDLHGRVHVPTLVDPSTATTASLKGSIDAWLDYIDTHLADAANLMSTFLPFPLIEQDPWSLMDLPVIDIDRDSGWFNSGTKTYDVYGDTGDPTNDEVLLFDEADSLKALFFTRHCQPIWSEIKLSTAFWLEDDVTDDTFKLITPHFWHNAILVDDAFDSFVYDGSDFTTASVGYRYSHYVESRYALPDTIAYGVQKPGLFGAWLDYSAIQRMMRLETSYVFSVEPLKKISANMAGSSLREIRSAIKELVYSSFLKGL